MFNFISFHNLQPHVGKVFDFEHITEACMALDGGKVNGKIVVTVN
jgi:D-arabinose 1-dehydrogenase-like Zn-dependent alcohol dehydrogenase